MSKTLIVYYSLQGNTKRVAEMISEKIKADILELKPKANYNFTSAVTLGLAHIKTKYVIKLEPLYIDLSKYSEIYIGTPVWWYTFAPPIRSFIENNNLKNKNIRLFSTNRGANGKTFDDLKDILGDSK
uniref:flavodoxin n=1 Tax=Ilyobacter sp. TaxID=3100343 RepID=UPI003562675C